MVEITDREGLEAWLKDKPREVCVAIAARAALRSLPMLTDAFGRVAHRVNRFPVVLPCLRAILTASVTSNHCTKALRKASRRAEPPRDILALLLSFETEFAGFVAQTARSAIDTAADDDSDDYFQTNACEAADSAAHAVPAFDLWQSVSADTLAIEGGTAPEDLFGLPLWHEVGMPAEVAQAWDRLRDYMTGEDPRLAFWAEWYQRMLDGDPMDWAMQEEIALIPDADWKAGPDRIAQRIGEIEARFELRARIAELEAKLAQGDAARRGIGGNLPPEPIEEAAQAGHVPPELAEPVADLKAESAAETPDRTRVRRALDALIGGLVAAGVWAGGHVNASIRAIAVSIGAAGGPSLVAWLAGYREEVQAVIDAGLKWLGFL